MASEVRHREDLTAIVKLVKSTRYLRHVNRVEVGVPDQKGMGTARGI